MPFINPFGFRVPNVTTKAKDGTNSGAKNQNPVTNPGRSTAPQQPLFAATDSTWVYTDQKTLGSSLTQGFQVQLPQAGIVEIDLSLTDAFTGSITATDLSNTIDHIEFYDGDSGQQISSIPGGTYLYDHLVRFSPLLGGYRGYSGSALSNPVAALATSATAVFRIPVSIPAPSVSPHKMIIYYATLGVAAPGGTGATITNDIQVRYGDTPNGWLCIRSQNISLVSGTNFLNQLAIPAMVPVTELFLRTGAVTSLTTLQIMTGSTAVVPTQKIAFVAARDTADFGTALQSNTLILDLGTTFSIGPTSQFYLVTSAAVGTEELVWAWFSG